MNFFKKLFVMAIMIFISLNLSACSPLKAIVLIKGGELVYKDGTDAKIEFDQQGHAIIVQAKINDNITGNFLFDTGALTAIDKEFEKKLNLKNELEINAKGSGGGVEKVNLVRLDSINISNMEVRDCAAAVLDLSPVKKFGVDIDGIIGNNYLKFFKVIIDYQKKSIVLSTDYTTPDQMKNGYKVKFKKDLKSGLAPKIKCVIDDQYEFDAIIDTGFSDYFAIPNEKIKDLKIVDGKQLIQTIGTSSGGAFKNLDVSYLFRINSFGLGSLKINHMIITNTGYDKPILGKKFLEKFLVVINYPKEELVLIQNNEIFETNIFSTGLMLDRNDYNQIVVSGYLENSPAEKQGIQIGDQILSINSKDVRDYTLIKLSNLLNDEQISEYEILLNNAFGTRKFTLEKVWLFPEVE